MRAWWNISIIALAGMASACIMEPVVEERGTAESAAGMRPSCAHHYSCCMDTKLGDQYDTPDHTRCYYCQSRCNDEGSWPSETYYGKDCEYWRKKYEKKKPRGECS